MSLASPTPDLRTAAQGTGVGCGVVLAIGILLELAGMTLIFGAGELSMSRRLAVGLPVQCFFIAVLTALQAARSTDGLRAALGLLPARWWPLAIGIIPVGVLSDLAVQVAKKRLPVLDLGGLDYLAVAVAEPGWPGLLVTLGAVVGAPVAEEFLFRGLVYRGLERSLGAAAAIGLSGILFALYHMDPLHMVGVIWIGLWLGWLRWCTRSLLPCIAAHLLNNLIWVVGTRAQWSPATPLWVDAVSLVWVVMLIGWVHKKEAATC